MDALSTEDKLRILGDAAKYDVSCASSGVDRSGTGSGIGSSISAGICHSFTEDGRCVSLLKVLMSNNCVFDCKYCVNRRSNSIAERTAFLPEELAELTIAFYRRNYIEGLFLSSAVDVSPDDTMERMCYILYLLRTKYEFYGYIHCKSIPGCDPRLIELAGILADRVSVNIELPTNDSLIALAPQKKKEHIFGAMRYIKGRIDEDKKGLIKSPRGSSLPVEFLRSSMPLTYGKGSGKPRNFVPGGQSTQIIVGATEDTDKTIITLTENLYSKVSLKRVYYSAYIPVNNDNVLPDVSTPVPLLREHRLYQADWLLRFYHFKAKELLSDSEPNFDLKFDPKCNWALLNLDYYPVEVNTADYYMLLRVPGIGVKSAERIISSRSVRSLDFDDLKRIGVVLKRAQFFITCKGHTLSRMGDYSADFIKAQLSIDTRHAKLDPKYYELSLFDYAGIHL